MKFSVLLGQLKKISSELEHRVGPIGSGYILGCLDGIYFEAMKGSQRASEVWHHMEGSESLYRGRKRSLVKVQPYLQGKPLGYWRCQDHETFAKDSSVFEVEPT